MRYIFILPFFALVYGQLGQQTTRHPWYWKPNKEPLAVYTTTTDAAELMRVRREITVNRGWYEEWQKRKNQTWDPPPRPPTSECPKDVIHDRYHGHGYFFSWLDKRSTDLRLDWNQAVYFCRARCLEPVSIETPSEHNFLAQHIINGRQRSVWTSGRKCDFPGCENHKEMQPADIYGWFWEGSRIQLAPTTDRFDTLWSNTGALGQPQPDNHEGKTGGERESCLAVLNNAYNDGIAWHDVACSKRKPFICEEPLKRYPQWPRNENSAENHSFEHHLIKI